MLVRNEEGQSSPKQSWTHLCLLCPTSKSKYLGRTTSQVPRQGKGLETILWRGQSMIHALDQSTGP